jgi:hypothetical protein
VTLPAPLTPVLIVVLAHNEEGRIARCLNSLPLGMPDVAVHIVVNGSSDRTAAIAHGFAGVTVHDWPQGGKSRSWSRFLLDETPPGAGMVVLVDGDAEILPGSVESLAATLAANPDANAAAGMPANGRRAAPYRAQMRRDHGLFGDLYALRGSFVDRMRSSGIRLPDDCIGDDGLIGALAKTDLGHEDQWQDVRVIPCESAGFLCEQVSLASARTWVMQYRRMRNYSLRHFQNQIISAIMRSTGPTGLPRRLATLYPAWTAQLTPRRSLRWWWFDRQALARMRAEGKTQGMT